MKLTGKRVDSFLSSPDPAVIAVLVYGPDAGLVKERLDRLAKTIVTDLSDPFRVTDLPAGKLKDDPARLADEAAAMSLTGGRRVVRLRDAGDAISGIVQSFLTHPMGDSLILIEAGELTPRSSLRKLAEDAANAAALPCYADDGGNLESVIQESLKAQGLTAEPDAIAWLADHLGGDRLLTRSELSKLALYMGDVRRVGLSDVTACIGDSSALALDELPMAIADGDQAGAQRILERLFAEGTAPIAVLRGLQRHFLRLHGASAAVAAGKSVEQALASLKPPPHFRVSGAMGNQLRRWPIHQLSAALESLLLAEMDCKTTGMPAKEICGRVALQLTRAAKRGRS